LQLFGTMHRAHGKRKNIKKEGHNSLFPYNTNKDNKYIFWLIGELVNR